MYRETYECPAIVELGSLHEQTLSWMVGADGGFGGHLSKHNASVRKFGSFSISNDDDGSSDDDSYTQVKSSGSRGKHGGGGDSDGGRGGGGRHGGSGGHSGFNVSDAFKGFGGSH